MPDDCGELMERYYRKALLNMQGSTKHQAMYASICPYCKTNPKKDTCVNCGAPQEESISRIPPVSLF